MAGSMMPRQIRLLVSDVDGTLVTHDKRLTDATVAAVRRLEAAGIGFTIVSSRPPVGLRSTVAALGLTLPVGAFNGGAILAPDFTTIEEHDVPEAAARETVRRLEAAGIAVWVFAEGRWYVTDPDAEYVPRERRTIAADPVVVPDFEGVLAHVGKIVGSSSDFAKLAACEAELAAALGDTASAARSQPYYLDITPAGISKGTFLTAISRHTGIPVSGIAAIGDMDNDVPMLRAAGLSIAVGNASDAARAAATHHTRSNEEDGVAYAIDTILLG